MDLAVRTGEVGSLPAILTLPQVEPTAGIVTLHPATGAGRDFFLFRHLAALVAPLGVAVLSYDRRPAPTDDVSRSRIRPTTRSPQSRS